MMSLYTGSSMKPLNHRVEWASVVAPPLIDRSKVAASLLLRCDHSASISIDVTGFPFPQVTWYLDSRPIVDSPEFRVARDVDGRKHTLIVARVTEDLESGLRVKAVNCAGQDQWAFEIKTYKLFTGRSQSDGMKSTTLPLHQSTGRRKGPTTEGPKSLRHKKHKRFEVTQDEYDSWQKEMERRSHMRSIDDILDNFSDDDSATASHPKQNETKSEDNCVMEAHSSSYTVPDSVAPSPSRQVTAGSVQEQWSSASRTSDIAFRDSTPTRSDMSALMRAEALSVTPGFKAPNEARDLRDLLPPNDIPLWEMFGVKLSELCRTILASNAVASVDRQTNHGTRGSATQSRDDIVRETSHPSKPQSRSVPVERKALGLGLVKNQDRPVYPEKNTRTAISKERCSQQETVKVRLLSGNPTQRMTQMPDEGGSPNLRPTIHPKGDAIPLLTQMSGGGGSPNLRPPLAPKPSSTESRQMRGTTGIKNQVPTNMDVSGSLRADSLAASLPRYRTGAHASNSDAKFPPKPQTSQATRPTVLNSFGPRHCTWEPTEKGILLPESSSQDRGQYLFQLSPAVDQFSAEIRGEERKRLEIKRSTATRVPSGEILETHFNEPQKVSETFTTNLEPVSDSYAVEKVEVVKGDLIVSRAGSDVVRKKPPIAKEKPFWNPATGVKGRGIPRASHALPLKAEHVEIGLKQNSELQPTSGSQSTPSKPTLVRRARSQSSGRSEEMTVSCEEETAAYPFGMTSAVQLSCSQDLMAGDPTQETEQSGFGRSQALAAKSEGLLTTRKRGVSPTCAGAVAGGGGNQWRRRMPVSKSVDLLDATRNMEALQRIGRRSLSKEWQVVTVTTKEEITILHRPVVTCVTSPTATTTTATTVDQRLTYRPQLRSSKPFAV